MNEILQCILFREFHSEVFNESFERFMMQMNEFFFLSLQFHTQHDKKKDS